MATPYKCPICDGTGKVSRPPWIPEDVHIWSHMSALVYPCRICMGSGIIWEPDRTARVSNDTTGDPGGR